MCMAKQQDNPGSVWVHIIARWGFIHRVFQEESAILQETFSYVILQPYKTNLPNYIRSYAVTEKMTREKRDLFALQRTVPV